MTASISAAQCAPLQAALCLAIGHVLVFPLAATAAGAIGSGQCRWHRQATELDAVQATGSRIARPDYASSSLLTTLSRQALQHTGATTVEEAINQLPQLGLGANKANAGWGGSGQATLNLRGLGAQRNLVLLDGRCLQPSGTGSVVDVHAIPTALIEGVQIISGGASRGIRRRGHRRGGPFAAEEGF